MRNILLVIRREYVTRVRKRSFIIMTILGPILMALLFIAPAWIAGMEEHEEKIIAVIDETYLFNDSIPQIFNVDQDHSEGFKDTVRIFSKVIHNAEYKQVIISAEKKYK